MYNYFFRRIFVYTFGLFNNIIPFRSDFIWEDFSEGGGEDVEYSWFRAHGR